MKNALLSQKCSRNNKKSLQKKSNGLKMLSRRQKCIRVMMKHFFSCSRWPKKCSKTHHIEESPFQLVVISREFLSLFSISRVFRVGNEKFNIEPFFTHQSQQWLKTQQKTTKVTRVCVENVAPFWVENANAPFCFIKITTGFLRVYTQLNTGMNNLCYFL